MILHCTKCQGCLDETDLKDSHSRFRIRAIRCLNCGKYWYCRATSKELKGDYYKGEFKSRAHRYRLKVPTVDSYVFEGENKT